MTNPPPHQHEEEEEDDTTLALAAILGASAIPAATPASDTNQQTSSATTTTNTTQQQQQNSSDVNQQQEEMDRKRRRIGDDGESISADTTTTTTTTSNNDQKSLPPQQENQQLGIPGSSPSIDNSTFPQQQQQPQVEEQPLQYYDMKEILDHQASLQYPHKDLFPELPKLMFAFGDSEKPAEDTCSLLSQILYHQMTQMALDLTTGVQKPRIGMKEVFFEMRDDPVKIERANKIVKLRTRMKMLERNDMDTKSFVE